MLLLACAKTDSPSVSLFDGHSFQGWNGDTVSVWRIEDGVIVGGSLEGNPRNEFLATNKVYKDFHLRLEYRLIGTEGFINGGVQFHSQRISDPPNEMIGYQADIGAGLTGHLYDESRRRNFLAKADTNLTSSIEKVGEWNQYEIIAQGNQVKIFLNGKQTIEYQEQQAGIPHEGHIALQIHGDCKAEISFRNLYIEELEDSVVAQTEHRPNFVIIMVDDMGYAGVSCFGNPYFETPEIDRLAAEGMRLTDFHSSGTVCSPTRTGLLTGRYQQRAGIEAVIHPVRDHPEHRKGLQKSEITFAEMLQSAGYTTGLIGKWHQGYVHNSPDYHPQNHGFDEFIGYHSGNIDFVSHVGDHNQHDWWHGREETTEEGYVTDLINRYALEFIERNQERPFCLYIPHLAIHNPVQVRGDSVRRTEEGGWNRWKPANESERIEKYRGMTLPIDEGVGQIRQKLISLGLDHKTLVLFFSDNGAAAYDFPSGSPELRGNKGSVYEGGHKVPFIAWWPGKIEGGSQNNSPGITLDIMPTLLSLAGVEPPEGHPLDGVDLSPLLLKQQPLPERPLYWASLSNKGHRAEAMRDGPWKLVVHHPQARQGSFEKEQVALYRLDQDPAEKTDLAAQQSNRATAMLGRLKAWYADTQHTATPQLGGWPRDTKKVSENQ
jgi:arylsulfatase A-like enzyme